MPVEGPQYPVNLVLAGRRCLVVGGGRIAKRKAEGLLAAGAEVVVVAPEIDEGLGGLPLSVERRPYREGEAAGFRLVITATGDAAVDGLVYRDAEEAGVWVNSADDPDHCSFTLPAVARRGPITVAIGTGGHSPALASWLRSHVESEMGPEYVTLLELLAEHRAELQAAGTPTEGLSWQAALDSGMLDLVRAGRLAEARERLQACL